MVFSGTDLALPMRSWALSSLASLIPVAFERALQTEAVVMHEARLRAVVEGSPVALIGLRPDGGVSLANRAALDLFQWATDPAEWALDEPIRPAMLDLAASVRETGATRVNRTLSVEGLDLTISGAPLPATSPADEGTVLVAGVDLSEIRRAERTLVQAQRLEAMGVVAGRVAHDFNNLLTLIIGYTELLARGLVDTQQQALVTDIEGAARRAAQLTKQMLGMTRREGTTVVIDLSSELANLQAVLSRLAGPKVLLRIASPEAPVKARVDPSEIEQIVINLVVNACDAMEGEGQIDVTLAEGQAGPWTSPGGGRIRGRGAVLTIADNGPGMPPDVLTRCLEPFFTTKRRGQGSGLGMSTVYGLVTERGGHMDIDSDPTGTAIRIWLPLSEDAAVADRDEGEVWPPGQTIAGRILLVEDEPDLRLMAQQCLASVGLDVLAAESAELAESLLKKKGPFDALVTDIMLPGRSGVQLAESVKGRHPRMPVLFMTAYAGSPTATGMPGPDANILRKPYRPDALRLRVAELLRESLQGSKR